MTKTAEQSEGSLLEKAWRFLHRPAHEKSRSVFSRWRKLFPEVPFPVRLSFGALWIARNDAIGASLTYGGIETDERAFVQRFLQPGMTVLDIGAHQGLYSLLASRRVGPSGRVFSFEPSPRERRALRWNLALNFSRNVAVQPLALGSQEGVADLFVVQDTHTGCNSLRPPNIPNSTKPVRVQVTTLDHWLAQNRISRVDFIKLDVEGAEIEVLRGAAGLLQSRPRPVILAEVQDIRTAPWGYRAKEILTLLRERGYAWFRISPYGSLAELDLAPDAFDGNFVACPSESAASLRGLPTKDTDDLA